MEALSTLLNNALTVENLTETGCEMLQNVGFVGASVCVCYLGGQALCSLAPEKLHLNPKVAGYAGAFAGLALSAGVVQYRLHKKCA